LGLAFVSGANLVIFRMLFGFLNKGVRQPADSPLPKFPGKPLLRASANRRIRPYA